MKLSQYAKKLGLTYKTAFNHYNKKLIPGAYQLATGTIIVPDDFFNSGSDLGVKYGVVLYARTSSSSNKKLLEEQCKRLEMYAIVNGYKIKNIVKEFGSGLNDSRPKLTKILKDGNYDKIVVEHKDRLTRFGFNWFQVLTNNRIEVINESKTEDEDITRDLISIIHCFAAKIYGLRRSRRKAIEIKNMIDKVD
jgi:predicted site-specific integrase-resolvase